MSVKKKTKSDLINATYNTLITEDSSLSRDAVKSIVQGFLEEIKSSLNEGYTIELRGLGVFEFRYRKGKANARNPKTGNKVTVPGHTVVAFRSGKELKESVWDKKYGKEL